jgi:hypothetical protein
MHRIWIAGILVLQACATENVTEVIVASVSVRPANAAVIAGGTVEFDAMVADDGGAALDGAEVTWSSDAPDVVFVDTRGVAQALSKGAATIEASFRGVTGSATVVVLPGPSIELSPVTASFLGAAGGKAPPSQGVRIDNGGSGTLSGLVADVQYESGGPTGWLTAQVAASTSPTTLTLTSDIEDLPAGVYDAVVLVTSDREGVEDAALPVRLSLAGFTLAETGGGTTVRETGTKDAFTVVLDLEPAADLSLTVTSMDPGEATVSPSRLTFTRSNWSTPRTVIVTGVDDVVVDGDATILVRVSIDGDPGDAYAAVEDQGIEVTVLDDDVAGFQLTETGSGTAAREGGGPDTFSVVLTAQPLSDVVYTVSVDDETDASVSPDRLTFKPLGWNLPQPVSFTAVDDCVRDGTRHPTVTVSVDSAASDSAFHGLSKTLAAITLDNDWLGWGRCP